MDQPTTCPSCKKPLPTDAPAGLCPECLLKAGFPTGTQTVGRRKRRSFDAPTPAELAPHFPQLEVLELVGQGGMGAVYRARQPALDRLVALKIIPTLTADDPGFAARFSREARALAQLSHPNIVAIHDFGQAGEFHYFIMEFVDGVNLRRLLETGKISPREALAIVPQVCDALQFAHDRGVVHRDIKPENILLNKAGTVKIADFGLAKLVGDPSANDPITGAGDVMGTPHYMAPEQVEHPLEVDHRADIYSLGVVFYQMLTGELPLGRFAVPSRKVQIDVRLDEIVLRALEKEPDLRFQQASTMKTEVETVSSTKPGPAVKAASVGDTRRYRPWLVFMAGAAALVLGILVARVVVSPPPNAGQTAPTEPDATQPRPILIPVAAPQADENTPNQPRPRVIPPTQPEQQVVYQQVTPPEKRDPALDMMPTPTPSFSTPALPPNPTDFDRMESDPEILRLQLAAAERDLQAETKRYQVGTTTGVRFRTAENQVALLKAKLAGDRIGFARISLAAAEKEYAETKIRRDAGLITDREVSNAELALNIAQIYLRDAEALVAKNTTK